ncbi:hypothetical protein BELL_0086g00050 [Botrytis elliptica]|uniref:BTB domain-containing protein n=1 Tax=Botrytis elliptica TaxID=278938 RepID=A0A4Z1JVI4_9HELO|nr:hypothetical protein EAE99_004362 [Botrytis elliptica]TGO77899.1 hypothetical protein BELL_0086g00050 [Botrytis elliptica]
MPPKAPRMQYQRGEKVMQVDDPGNHAFKAQPVKNGRKRTVKNNPIEIDSDDEQSQPSKKPRPNPRASKSTISNAKQGKDVVEYISESEDSSHPEVVPCANLPLRKLFKPFADHDADIYIVLIQKSPEYSFRMHSYILRRASPWFAGQLQENLVNEVDEKLAATITQDTGIKYRFELRFDDHLGYHTLKRVGLTMYKQQPQAIINRDIPDSSNRYNGCYNFSNYGSSNSRQSSLFLPQFDGSCDDIEMAETMSNPHVSPDFDISVFLSSPGALQSTQGSISGSQGNENGIKLQPDTIVQSNSAEPDLPAQNNVMEQVATPPTSPTKVLAETETDQTVIQSPQIGTSPQTDLSDQIIPTVDTAIKAEIESEEQMLSPSLPEHKSPERQLQVVSNVEEKVDGQLSIELQKIEVPPGRQISPEEQLQVAISMENPMGPEIKIEEAQQATISLSKQQPKIDPIVKEPSSNYVVEQKDIPTAEKPINDVIFQKLAPLKVEQKVLDAYRSLFLCYFGCAPTISTTNSATAASQSMLLIKIANLYDSAKVVRPYIVASLLSLGRSLYASIRRNPPNFLLLAYKLQCSPIFKEALIHIVGQYPSWPWLTKEDRMGHDLGRVIRKKFEDLQDMRFEANGPLFQSCIVKDKVRVSINNLDRSTFDVWVIVQIWHDWFSQQLRHCTLVQRHEHRNVEKNMYKLIAQGGDAYLKIDDVMAMIEPFRAGSEAREWGHWEKDQVELQLNILKESAAKKVSNLVANELMGDTGGNAGEIEYLTCTKVHEHELPWTEAQMVIIED